mmetsp:Transcript_16798/g.57361  ORF Transcript_16798/g.57361 Transcript_16798/m.57361 type:complete len:267 (-) Transcript_16798:3378-4178(-)
MTRSRPAPVPGCCVHVSCVCDTTVTPVHATVPAATVTFAVLWYPAGPKLSPLIVSVPPTATTVCVPVGVGTLYLNVPLPPVELRFPAYTNMFVLMMMPVEVVAAGMVHVTAVSVVVTEGLVQSNIDVHSTLEQTLTPDDEKLPVSKKFFPLLSGPKPVPVITIEPPAVEAYVLMPVTVGPVKLNRPLPPVESTHVARVEPEQKVTNVMLFCRVEIGAEARADVRVKVSCVGDVTMITCVFTEPPELDREVHPSSAHGSSPLILIPA